MSAIKYLRITDDQIDRIRALKVHDRQADHEIVSLLLDTYERYVQMLNNGVDVGR